MLLDRYSFKENKCFDRQYISIDEWIKEGLEL